MTAKKFITKFAWVIVFHATTSLFYLCMLLTFMYTKNVILTGRMITTWYLAFHTGFIFLRLIQDFINLTPMKNSKFNEIFTKFNNLVFISLIFPFALYLPLVYWLLFFYDSNLMLPNFVEISLPTWVSTSSHSVIALVALIEMTTAKYTYEGNHVSSLIIMSIFSAGYILCLIETYVQYGFWLYPVFHLVPTSYLPVILLLLIVLLLFVYFVGKIIAQRLIATGESDVKFTENYSNNTLQTERTKCRRDSQTTEEQHAVSSLIVFKQVLEKIMLSPLRSNIQKIFCGKKRHFKEGDEAESLTYSAAKEKREIPLGAAIKTAEYDDKFRIAKQKIGKRYCYCFEAMENDHEVISHVTILKNISTNQSNENNQLNPSNLTQENDNLHSESQRTNPHCKESSNSSVDNDDANDIYETADEMNPYHEDGEKSPLVKSAVAGKWNTDENVDLNNAVSYSIEREHRNKKRDNLFRFRLHLFPHNSSENSAPKKRQNFNKKTSDQEDLYPKVKQDKSHYVENHDSDKRSETDSVKSNTDSENDLKRPLMENCNENSHYASISFGKSKIKVIPNLYETCKRASKFRFQKGSKEITRPSINKSNKLRENNVDNEISPNKPSTSGINISNSSPKNSDSNMEQNLAIDSTIEYKSDERNKKIKNKRNENNIETHEPRKIENTLKSRNTDLHDWKQEKHNQRIYDDVDPKETNVEDGLENKTTRGVKFKTMKILKLNLSKGKKGNDEKLTNDETKCQCGQNSAKDKPQSETTKQYEKNFTNTLSDHSNDKKTNKRKKRNRPKIRGNESVCSFSTSSLDRSQDHCISQTRKEQSENTNQKTLEKLIEEKGNFQDEKSRYEILPKLNTRLKKINAASSLCSSEKQCNKKKTTGKENEMNESINDLPGVQEQEYSGKCSSQSGDNMKKKFIDRFLKFSKRTSKGDEEKKFAEIFKKCANGSKIGAIFATVPGKNEIHLNIDLENAKILQDLQTSLSSNGGKLFKFCVFLS